MRPDDATIELIEIENIGLMVKCFEQDTLRIDEPNQAVVNMLFAFYVMGIHQPITPGSTFSVHYADSSD